MQFQHIMLDLETLGTATSSVITAIGAVAFDPSSKQLGDRFYVVLGDWAEQQKYGRTIDADTVKWWMEQSDAAREALILPPVAATTGVALNDFREFCNMNGGHDVKLWGNGADFDCVLLSSLYGTYNIGRPWSFRNNRCYRTIKGMGWGPAKAQRVGVHHNALDDAITQAVHLQEMLQCVKTTPSSD